MQSRFITLLAAGLVSGTAFAQSGPTVYGVADLAVDSVKAEGATVPKDDISSRMRLNANSSLLGVKGKVDVGNGNSVIYQYETYIDLGNSQITAEATPIVNDGKTVKTGGFSGAGSGSVFGSRRDSFLGLTGTWGTLKAGYLSTGFRATTANFDLAPGATGVTTSYNVFGKIAGTTSFFDRSPSVAYQTPKMQGFTAGVTYIPNSAKSIDGDVNPSGWDILGRYDAKNFKVAVVHTSLTDAFFGGYASESHTSDAAFASYTFPSHTTLTAMYDQYSGTVVDFTTKKESDLKQNSFYIGIKQEFGKHEIMGNYVAAQKVSGSLMPSADTGATQIALRYAYKFFKNTQAYVSYSKITNDANTAYNFTIGGIGGSTGAKVAKGSDPTSVAFGLRFSF